MTATANSSRFEEKPLRSLRDAGPAFRIRVGYEARAAYDDLRDAIRAGRMMKQDHPTMSVTVVDARTGLYVIDFD